jgi:hypothetical protein
MLSNLLLKFLFLMVKISKFFFSLMLLEILHVTASGYISPAWIKWLVQENINKLKKILKTLRFNLKSLFIK